MSDPQSFRALLSDSELPDPAAAAVDGVSLTLPPTAGMTSRVVRGSLWNLGGQGVTMLATLVATPFTIRLLGPSGYGVLALINILISYLAFADMGMAVASTRFGSEAHARGDEAGEAEAIGSALLLAAVPALAIALALAFVARPLVEHGLRLPLDLHEPAVVALRLAAVGLLARALAGVLNTPEVVRLRMDLVALVNVGTSVGQILLVPFVLFLGGGITGAVAVIASAGVAAALLHAIIGVRLLPRLRRPHIGGGLLKPLARFGGAVVISTFATAVLTNAEKLLLPRYGSVRALAFYTVAFNLSFMLTLAPMAMVQALLPAFSQLQANPDRTALHQLYRRALRGTLYWVAPVATFICVVARPFFTAWAGPEFGRESTPLLYLLAGGLVCEVMTYAPSALLIALGRTDLIVRCQVALLVPYLVGSVLLINEMGAAGAAVAWSLRALVNAALLARIARRVSGFDFSPWPDREREYFIALVILLLPALVAGLSTPSTLVRLGVTCAALALHGAMIWTRVLTNEERTAMQRMLPPGRWRGRGSAAA